jgi:hypothetical protein
VPNIAAEITAVVGADANVGPRLATAKFVALIPVAPLTIQELSPPSSTPAATSMPSCLQRGSNREHDVALILDDEYGRGHVAEGCAPPT